MNYNTDYNSVEASRLIALTDDNTLVSFDSDNPKETEFTEVTGVEGVLLGIDTRPANGMVYSIDTLNNIYTIDPSSGEATYVSTLDTPFEGGIISGFDFNPVADRLRLVGDNDQDFRINVDTGEVTVDGMLAFADGDVNSGVNPNITAAAYINSFDGTTSTQLYDIDTLLNDLVLQNPPNDGTLMTIGDLGVDFDTLGGFDIVSGGEEGDNTAYAVSNTTLYGIDLGTGEASDLGTIGSDSPLNLQGLTAVSDREPTLEEILADSKFVALTDDNTLISFDPNNPSEAESNAVSTEVTGVEGVLLGIDTRPANGMVYSIDTLNNIYTIDTNSGEATYVSTLDTPFEGGTISGFDFNPAADRLRLVGDNDQDFRINVDTGEVTVDGDLAFADGDVNDGVNPNVTAVAYTNSFDGTDSTELYDIDTLLNDLVLQNPPNDGTLMTIGDLGIDFDTLGGFDIVSSTYGENAAFAISNSTLYSIDLDTGVASAIVSTEQDLNVQGFTAVFNDSDNSDVDDEFDLPLEEAQTQPMVPDTEAEGSFDAALEGNTLTVSGEYSDLTSPLFFVGGEDAAGNPESPIHIHVGEAGESGPILRNLSVTEQSDNSGSFSGSFELSSEDAATVESEGVYINLHTEQNNSGELRGQVIIEDESNSGSYSDSEAFPGIDLSLMSDTDINFTVDRDAGYENTVGFYEVDRDGTITDAESGATISVGDEDYSEAAIANRVDVSLNGVNGSSTEVMAMFEGGSSYAPFLVVDGAIEQLEDDDSSNDPVVYFLWSDANLGNSEQIQVTAENTFGFEDLSLGGDADFNDMVLSFDFA